MADNTQQYQWVGMNSQGERLEGVIEANDMSTAQTELNRMSIEVISLEPKPLSSFNIFSKTRKKKIKTRDILLFTRYLATMLSAGLPIVQALEVVSHDQENPSMQTLLIAIKNNIEGGKSLAESFGQYPNYFSDLYINLIKAGEASGTLDGTLTRLGNYLERTENLKRKIKKALVYPCAILAIALIVSLILLIFVVPQFQVMFKSFGAELPLFTRLVVKLSELIRTYWWLIILMMAGVIFAVKHSLYNERFQQLLDVWVLKIPTIGPVLRKGIIARFTRTLATTLEAGMPIVESMKSMSSIVGNSLYSKAILQLCDDVTAGRQLSESMSSTKLFPNMAIQMISVGEVSGALGKMLNKVADYYEEDVASTVDNLSSLLEPLIMLVLGVVIGGFVIAMYLPIFKLGSVF